MPAVARVAYCIEGFVVGGTELNAVRTAEALCRRPDVELTVFHFHADGPLKPRYESLGVRLVHLPIGPLWSPRTARQARRFMKELARGKFNVVHSHDVYTNIFAAPAARLVPGIGILASRRWWHEVPRPGIGVLNRWSYALAHRILANSRGVALLLRREGVPAEKVVEIPNFVDDEAFLPALDPDRMRRRRSWGIPDHAHVVGIVARLAPVKNHALLLDAMAKLDRDCHLAIVGGGPCEAALRGQARTLGIESRVHFAGEVVADANLHAAFDVSVLCSRSEGFPNSLIEAMAAQRPVVATNVGGVPDAVVDGVTGLLVEEDADSLADALKRLLCDRDLRARLGSEGCRYVQREYSRAPVIFRLAEVYSELSGAPRATLRSAA